MSLNDFFGWEIVAKKPLKEQKYYSTSYISKPLRFMGSVTLILVFMITLLGLYGFVAR